MPQTGLSVSEYRAALAACLRGKPYTSCVPRKSVPRKRESVKKPCVDSIRVHTALTPQSLASKFEPLKTMVRDGQDQEILLDAIVHGSYGDETFTSFSDLEITIVLNEAVFTNHAKAKSLSAWVRKQLNPFILDIDPLQHHGAFFLWDRLVKNYNSSILPVSAYDSAWSLEGTVLEFKTHALDKYTQKKAALTTAQKLLDPEKNFLRGGGNLYEIKRLLSNFMLLPALSYQSRGIEINKKNAIYAIVQDTAEPVAAALSIATRLRESWPDKPRWLSWLRKRAAGREIPSGRVDSLCLHSYRDQSVREQLAAEFLPVLKPACHELQAFINEKNY